MDPASEALALSIGEKARIDLPFMSELCGKTEDEIIEDLRGVIFKKLTMIAQIIGTILKAISVYVAPESSNTY